MDAKAGEPIIIIAQSNAEWFVAKPIGRLGGPGLIPVSFVDIRDASTGRTVKNDLIQAPSSSVFPNVEDWKKKTQGYEASSISIGRMERQMQDISIEEEEIDPVDDYYDMKDHHQNPDALLDNYGMTHLVSTSSTSILDSPAPASSTSSRKAAQEEGAIVVSAYIDSHILEGDQYWFIVFARLANGKHRVLYRLYEGEIQWSNSRKKKRILKIGLLRFLRLSNKLFARIPSRGRKTRENKNFTLYAWTIGCSK